MNLYFYVDDNRDSANGSTSSTSAAVIVSVIACVIACVVVVTVPGTPEHKEVSLFMLIIIMYVPPVHTMPPAD